MTTPPVAQQQNFFQRPWVRRGGLILLGLIVLGLLFALWILGPTKTVNVPGPERTVIVTQEVIKTVEVPGGKEIVIETQEVVQTVIVTDEVPAEGTPITQAFPQRPVRSSEPSNWLEFAKVISSLAPMGREGLNPSVGK